MPALYLALAISSEICATVSLKYTHGFTRLLPSLIVVLGYVASFALLSQALKQIPVSSAYAIWSGVGTAVVAAIGFAFLGEGVNLWKVLGIALIIVGVIALNLGGATH
ncbi:QacE family quaternary ammonium compound efflux SMR transporter [Streptacidiphilus pinicola]|uniref:QacE family quaternary ammonium compound efflux SMR transporter n=1 Tax=Streptacidiphilus pinicola TaxID=2219663 RepID=A0A2X0IVQ8_9ACTN|nr:multidrug efflux SMR transporter [Streptacidiphilus pinicola]RAG87531.1 QacE family quaternary ammonium compound efflux SMR transporter [Streptacidiphilus pinicola]